MFQATLFGFLLLGQVETLDSADFPAKIQVAAVTATVRITNEAGKDSGSGVIIGRKGAFVYILTAQHVIAGAERLEVEVFSPASYPRPHRRYRSAQVVAGTDDIRDLALIRLVTDDPIAGSLALCPARLLPREDFKGLSVGCGAGKAPRCQIDEVLGKKLVRREGEGKTASFWEVDREQLPGRSGGPLIDKRGLLLGVCSGVNDTKSYFCHTDEIRSFLERAGFGWLK